MAFSDDEMDLDEVPTTTTTSLPEDKDRDTGKRIVADLPADLDDTLPWCVLSPFPSLSIQLSIIAK